EARLQVLAAIVGIGAGGGASLLAATRARAGSLLAQPFGLQSPIIAVPVAITCIFFWGLAVCAVRWQRVRALERVSQRALVIDVAHALASMGSRRLSRALDGPFCQASPLLRRLQALLIQWSMGSDVLETHLILNQ